VNSDYEKRFWQFRAMEAECLIPGLYKSSAEQLALLRDLERCYASRAYFACLVMAASIVEIHLRKVLKHSGAAQQIIEKAGIATEIDWLRSIRNDIVHGNTSPLVSYNIDSDAEDMLEKHCQRALRFLHGPLRTMQYEIA